jgi:hypothetical protein
MSIGIEYVPCGVKWFDVVFEERLEEETMGHVDAFVQFE